MPSTPETLNPEPTKKIKTTRLFSSILYPSINKVKPQIQRLSDDGPFSLLALPRPVRVRIWKLLGFSHTKILRLVCKLIKEDIDKFTGISSAIDSTFEDFSFHCNIAIRKVAIHELIIPSYIEFLKYPNLLQELEIRGEISLQNFHYILKSCPNISKVLIIFNNFVLDFKTTFFPLPKEILDLKPFSKLRSIKLISTTKNFNEMAYVSRIVVSLLRDTLLENTNVIDSVHLSVVHKTSTIHFKEVLWTTLLFVHKNASRLRYLNLTFRDKNPNAAVNDFVDNPNQSKPTEGGANNTNDTSIAKGSVNKTLESSQNGEENKPADVTIKADQKKFNSSNARRDTQSIELPPGAVKTPHAKDIHSEGAGGVTATPEGEGKGSAEEVESLSEDASTSQETNAGIMQASKYLSNNAWPKANGLEQLLLTASSIVMEHILEMVSSNTRLQVLQLEMVGGVVQQSSWDFYKEFLQHCNTRKLKDISFSAVNHVDSYGLPLPIDLAIFRNCKSLTNLAIFSLKRNDSRKQSRAKGVSKLPKTLNEISFERVLLTPWQVIRLLICFRKMWNVSINYWSISDCQFSTLLMALKWTIFFKLSNVPQISLVDTKLRFRNKRRAVRQLQQQVKINVQYLDFNETKLVIDLTKTQDEMTFAPRLSIPSAPAAPTAPTLKSKDQRGANT